jgi:hypothetical protein
MCPAVGVDISRQMLGDRLDLEIICPFKISLNAAERLCSGEVSMIYLVDHSLFGLPYEINPTQKIESIGGLAIDRHGATIFQVLTYSPSFCAANTTCNPDDGSSSLHSV